MEVETNRDTRQHVHELVDQLPTAQLPVVAGLLKAIVHEDELTDEDLKAIAASREYFENGGAGITFEEMVAELGFTMEQVLSCRLDDPQ